MTRLFNEADERKRLKGVSMGAEVKKVDHRNVKSMAYVTFYDQVRVPRQAGAPASALVP